MPLSMYKEEKVQDPLSRVKNIVAVAAGKGGVGKSMVTVNLARALQQQGQRVGILDTDLYGPSLRKMMREDKLPEQKGSVLLPAESAGLKLMSLAYFKDENEAAVMRAPIANGVLKQFLRQVDWGDLDILLVDFPPGTGDIQLTLTQQAPFAGALMVTTPQEVARADVRKAMEMFQRVKVPILGVLENMGYYYHAKTDETLYLFGRGGGEALALEVGAPFMGSIPIDPELCRYADKGVTIVEAAPEGVTSQAFVSVARELQQHLAAMEEEGAEVLQGFEIQWRDIPDGK